MPKKSPPRWTIGSDSPIKMDRDFAAELRQAAAELLPDALPTMEAGVENFRVDIAKMWPVSPTKKGRRLSGNATPSATTWTSFGTVTAGGLVGSIGNPARYIYLIKSSQNGLSKNRSAYQQLVKDPARQVASKLAADLARSIVQTVTSDS